MDTGFTLEDQPLAFTPRSLQVFEHYVVRRARTFPSAGPAMVAISDLEGELPGYRWPEFKELLREADWVILRVYDGRKGFCNRPLGTLDHDASVVREAIRAGRRILYIACNSRRFHTWSGRAARYCRWGCRVVVLGGADPYELAPFRGPRS